MRSFAGLCYALASLACVAAVWESLSGDDALTTLLAGDLLAIAAFLSSAFLARSRLGTVVAILAVPYFLFDAFLRLLGAALATDAPRPISALSFYQAGGPTAYPLLGFLLIVAMGFALRERARLAWLGGSVVAAAAAVLCLVGRDASMLAGAWYLATAFELVRPRGVAVAAPVD